MTRPLESAYMQWAKLSSAARYNFATSGIVSVTRDEFPLDPRELEINAPGAYGYEPLLQRIAQHTGAPENSVVTAAGTSMANHLAMAAVLEPGDEVLIESPAYGLLVEVARYLGARVSRFSRHVDNDFAIDLAEIADAITDRTRLIVISNLHNPSGALVTRETLAALAGVARRVGANVLVDEVYLEMLFGREEPAAFLIDPETFIITNSLTKTYGLSGLRCGWILARPQLAKRMRLLNDFFDVNAPHLAERASVIAFDRLAQFRDRACRLLEKNRALLDAFLDRRSDLDVFRPPAGTVVFPGLKSGRTAEFVRLLREEYETSVVPGEFFEMPDQFRIGIGGATDDVRAGLERITAALDRIAP